MLLVIADVELGLSLLLDAVDVTSLVWVTKPAVEEGQGLGDPITQDDVTSLVWVTKPVVEEGQGLGDPITQDDVTSEPEHKQYDTRMIEQYNSHISHGIIIRHCKCVDEGIWLDWMMTFFTSLCSKFTMHVHSCLALM